jgi:hypothetical protein
MVQQPSTTMNIGIAGPYSADTQAARLQNLLVLNKTAATVLLMGHTPIIGVNAALPVVEHLPEELRYEAIMQISLAMIDSCDALLLIKESPGANRERDLVLSKGLPVYYKLEDIPTM